MIGRTITLTATATSLFDLLVASGLPNPTVDMAAEVVIQANPANAAAAYLGNADVSTTNFGYHWPATPAVAQVFTFGHGSTYGLNLRSIFAVGNGMKLHIWTR